MTLDSTGIDFLLSQLNAGFPNGLRDVSGNNNNLIAGQIDYGAVDRAFPITTHQVASRLAELVPSGFVDVGRQTSYNSTERFVVDSRPREISNIIIDELIGAQRKARGLVPEGLSTPLPTSQWHALFGQFFTHDLDLIPKGQPGIIYMPLLPGDPLYKPGGFNFMILSRANFAIDAGTGERISTNVINAWSDLGPTYGTHPIQSVFLREYDVNGNFTGRLLTHTDVNPTLNVGMPNWADVKANALRIGITLTDADVMNLPMVLMNADGTLVRAGNNHAQLVTDAGQVVRSGHALLEDMGNGAKPVGSNGVPLTPDANTVVRGGSVLPGEYDDEFLNLHFVTGDGRSNENYGLTTVHAVFHAEHNRMFEQIKASVEARGESWTAEQYYQAAKLVVEAQYQRVVFDEYVASLTPNVAAYAGYVDSIDPVITQEFAHAIFRFGHSQLPESVQTTDIAGVTRTDGLIGNFLNPMNFATLTGGLAGIGSVAYAAAFATGSTRLLANEIDEFITNAMRNALTGLPLDLAAFNIARGRDVGIPSLNALRADLFASTGLATLAPYTSWTDFGNHMLNPSSLKNFIMAYAGQDLVAFQSTYDATGWANLRATNWQAYKTALSAAADAAMATPSFMGVGGNQRFNDIDTYVGALAEAKVPGGMLGSTSDFIVATQMAAIRDADRFYYEHRLAGTSLLQDIESRSFSEVVMDALGAKHLYADLFAVPDAFVEMSRVNSWVPLSHIPSSDARIGAGWSLAEGVFTATGLSEMVGGTEVADHILGGAGNDTIYGDGGNDTIDGGANGDVVFGGEGNDLLLGGSEADTLKGDVGEDTLEGGTGADKLYGGAGADSLAGGEGDDELSGNAGNDTILGGAGEDTAVVASLRANSVVVRTGESTFTVTHGGEVDVLQDVEFIAFTDVRAALTRGSVSVSSAAPVEGDILAVNSTLTNAQGLVITGYQWQTADGLGGWLSIGGAIDATFAPDDAQVGRALRVIVSYTDPTGSGHQEVSLATAEVGNLNDAPQGGLILSTDAPLVGQQLTASSTITDADGMPTPIDFRWQSSADGLAWQNVTDLGASVLPVNAMLAGLMLRAVASYTDGRGAVETVYSAATAAVPASSQNLVSGTGNPDNLVGTAGNDRIEGFAGADTINGGGGGDVLVGGTQNDVYVVDNPFDVVVELPGAGSEIVESPIDWYLGPNLEALRLTGVAAINAYGNNQDNWLYGNGAPNQLSGGGGNDYLNGGLDADTMIGGQGNDEYLVTDDGDVVVERPDEGTDRVLSTRNWTLAANLENLTLQGTSATSAAGNELANAVIGNAQDNILSGLAGNDTLDGAAGNDTLDGGEGIDSAAFASAAASYSVLRSGDNAYVVTNLTTGEADTLRNVEFAVFGDTSLELTTGGVAFDMAVPTEDMPLSLVDTLANGSGITITHYQWQVSDGVGGWLDIAGASGPTATSYIPRDAQVNAQLRVVVTYSDPTGANQLLASLASGVVVGSANDAPLGVPVVVGTAADETVLTADTSGISDGNGLSGIFTYQWLRNGVAISGAEGATYTLDDGDVGSTVSVRVDFRDNDGFLESLTSAPTASVVNTNDAPTGQPIIVGTTTERETLSVSMTGLADEDGLVGASFAFQWLRNGNPISGETSATFLLRDADVGQTISVRVSYTDDGGAMNVVDSAITPPIAVANDLPTGSLTVDNAAPAVGQTITVSSTVSDPNGMPNPVYWRWQSSADGSTWTNILDNGTTSLVVGAGQSGQFIRAVASFVDGLGFVETVHSVPTSAVAPVAFNLINGTSGANNLTGGTGSDRIDALEGNDTLTGGAGADLMIGGRGHDTYFVDNVADTVVELAGQGGDTVYSTVSHLLAPNVEALTLQGTAQINGYGNDADNYLFGNSAPNVLVGGKGNDYLNGAGAIDTLIGGAGNDRYVVENSLDVIQELVNEGVDTVVSAVGYTLGANLENLILNFAFDVDATGNGLDNQITGNDAINRLYGLGGNDTFITGKGNDFVFGGTGQDTVVLDYSTAWTSIQRIGESTFAVTNLIEGELDTFTDVEFLQFSNFTIELTQGTIAVNDLTPHEDQPLTVVNGMTNSVRLTIGGYQWQVSDGAGGWLNIPAATSATFAPNGTHVGKQLRVLVQYDDTAGSNQTWASQPTAAVLANTKAVGSPVILGSTIEDQTLSVDVSSINDSDGMGGFTYQWLRNGADIAGAEGTNLQLGDDDVGARISVRVSFIDGNGSAEALTSAQTAPVVNVNDLPQGSPAIIGTVVENGVLTASIGSITDADGLQFTTYSYQWLRDGVNLAGQTNSIYTLTPADVGTRISFRLTFTDTQGTTEQVLSPETVPVRGANIAPQGQPVISGTAIEDSTLSIDVSGISDANGLPPTLNLQWLRDGVIIDGATGATYTLGDADVGAVITARASYVDGLGYDEAITSTGTEPVANVNDTPVGAPVITGIVAEDQTVSASMLSIADADGFPADPGFTYQWQRNGADVAGATNATFTLDNIDAGARLSVRTTYTDARGTLETVTSGQVLVSNVNDLPSGTVTLSNVVPQVGGTIVATSTVSDVDGIPGAIIYRWQSSANGGSSWVNVVDNGGATFTVSPAQAGLVLRAAVTYTDGFGTTETVVSAPTSAVPAFAMNVITGSAGNDSLLGTAGNDQINALAGNDTLDGGAGIDLLIGGATHDIYYVDNAADGILELANEGGDEVRSTVSWELGPNLEVLTLLGSGNLTGSGNALNNWLYGTSGTNRLSGGGGNDYLLGGAGADTMIGGTGDDIFVVDNGGDVVVEYLNEGIDEVRATVTTTLAAHVEKLALTGAVAINGTGNDFANTIVGNASGNVLMGLGGNDTLTGGAFNDTLDGGSGIDTASFSGSANAFAVTRTSDSVYTVRNLATNETDTLRDIEFVAFTDSTFGLTSGGVSVDDSTPRKNETLHVLSTLSNATSLSISGYQWQSSGNGSVWTNIAAATGNEFTPGNPHVGLALRVVVTYTDPTGSGRQVVSAPTLAVDNVNDPAQGSVSMSGTAVEDSVLTASPSITDGDGLGAFNYQWLRGGLAIEGATQVNYTLGDADVGASVQVRVSFVDARGTAESITSGVSAMVENINDVPAGGPSIVGAAVLNETLSANLATIIDADGFGTVSLQWMRDGVDVLGATGTTYAVTADDLGKRISVRGSYFDNFGSFAELTSAATAPVQSSNAPPSGDVTIVGNSVENAVLSADTSGIGDADGVGTFTYQWLRGSVEVEGATGATYVPSDADVDAAISVRVSYIDGLGKTESLTSSATGPIANVNDLPQGAPSITGTVAEDQSVSVSTVGITDADGMPTSPVFSYQWMRNGVEIGGATSASYTLGDADSGAMLSVRVGYTDARGAAESAVSGQILAANVNDLPTGSVTLNNTAPSVGQAVLAASTVADVDGMPGAVAYRWQSSSNGGGTWVDVVDNGNASFTVDVAQAGLMLRTLATYKDGFGTVESVASAPTSVVPTLVLNPVSGSTGADNLFGTAGNDQITALAGNDTLDGGTGADLLVGGAGSEIYFVDNAADSILELPGEGGDEVRSTVSWVLGPNVEVLTLLGSGSINGNGNALNNWLFGNSGSNRLSGGGGNDYLSGASGADTMLGGAGDDIFIVDNAGDVATEFINEGTDEVRATVNTTLWAHVEKLTLQGGGAISGTGNDLANIIVGNGSNNVLTGGVGADTLTGNGGADRFVLQAVTDSPDALSARDVITDFLSGTDRIDLSAIDANASLAGDQAFTVIGQSTTFSAAGQLAYQYEMIGATEYTVLRGEINGDGIADFALAIAGHHVFPANPNDLIP